MAVRSQLAAELLQEKARQYRKVASWLTARCLIKHLRKVGSEGECPPPDRPGIRLVVGAQAVRNQLQARVRRAVNSSAPCSGRAVARQRRAGLKAAAVCTPQDIIC